MSAYVVFTRKHATDTNELELYTQKTAHAREGRDTSQVVFYGRPYSSGAANGGSYPVCDYGLAQNW